jgi:hypothetical protein
VKEEIGKWSQHFAKIIGAKQNYVRRSIILLTIKAKAPLIAVTLGLEKRFSHVVAIQRNVAQKRF